MPPWALTSKGRTLRLLERYDDALACYEKALQIDPTFTWAYKSKGIILERLGRFDDALRCYEMGTVLLEAAHRQDGDIRVAVAFLR